MLNENRRTEEEKQASERAGGGAGSSSLLLVKMLCGLRAASVAWLVLDVLESRQVREHEEQLRNLVRESNLAAAAAGGRASGNASGGRWGRECQIVAMPKLETAPTSPSVTTVCESPTPPPPSPRPTSPST